MSVFKPILVASDIEEAVTSTLKLWFATYLREMSLVTARPVLPEPRSYNVRHETEMWPDDQMPAVIVVSPGVDGAPVKSGDGEYEAPWRVGVALFAHGKDKDSVNANVRTYAATIRSLLLQKRGLGGISSSIEWDAESYSEGPTEMSRTLGACTVEFIYWCPEVVNIFGGPASPLVPAPLSGPIVETEWLEVDDLREPSPSPVLVPADDLLPANDLLPSA